LKSRFFIVLFAVIFSANNPLFAQCCSGGNAAGGSSDVGIVEKKTLKVAGFYKYSFSNTYYEGDRKSSQALLQSSEFNFISLIMAYGITARLTIESELGYFISKKQHYNLSNDYYLNGYGLSNGVLSLKYNLYRNKCDDFEYTAGLGIKYPFSNQSLVVDGVQLPIDLQPSTLAYGAVFQSFVSKKMNRIKMRAILINRFEYNWANPNGYRFGPVLYSSLFISRKVYKDFSTIILLRDEWKQSDVLNGKEMVNTGHHLLILSPQLNFTFFKTWNLTVLYDYPLYKYYNGKQLSNKYGFGISLVKTIKCTPRGKKSTTTQP
jgi:hypothetical protein